jgi:hypothetical protein
MFAFSPNKDPRPNPAESASLAGDRGIPRSESWFSVESANRLLPLVSRIAQDLMRLDEMIRQQEAQMKGLEKLPKGNDIRAFSEELESVKESFRVDSERLDRVREELASLGVEIESLEDAAFAFPSLLAQRPIRLSWRIGEPEVIHWREVEETFRDRRPLAPAAIP